MTIKITKGAMGALFDGLDRDGQSLLVACLADFARENRLNSGHRLPEDLASRFHDFAVMCGVPDKCVKAADASHGYVAVRVEKCPDFGAALRGVGVNGDALRAKLAVHGPQELVDACADGPAPQTEASGAAPADAAPLAPLVPNGIARAFTKAAGKFLDSVGGEASVPTWVCTPDNWYSWSSDLDVEVDHPDGFETGEYVQCVAAMRAARSDGFLPPLSAIETALDRLGMLPELPEGVDRIFYALESNCELGALTMRYVAKDEALPDFGLLLTESPHVQYGTDIDRNPLRANGNYLSYDAAAVETLHGPGTAALVAFGGDFINRCNADAAAFATDTEKFWKYVRQMLEAWIAYGDPDLGVMLMENKLKLVFFPWSRVGVAVEGSSKVPDAYARGSERRNVDIHGVSSVAGAFDLSYRGSEDDYDCEDEDDEDENEERNNKLAREESFFRADAAAAFYGFAVVAGDAGVASGVMPAEHPVVIVEEEAAKVPEKDPDAETGADGALLPKDLPHEWSALIHGIGFETVESLREWFAQDGWFASTCVVGPHNTSFPASLIPESETPLASPPRFSSFLDSVLQAFRAMANGQFRMAGDGDYAVVDGEPHRSDKFVSAVYTGMTTAEPRDFADDCGAFTIPSAVKRDLFGDDQAQFRRVGDDGTAVSEWLDRLCLSPEIQLACEKRKDGDRRPRWAWVVVETNLPFDNVLSGCNNLYLSDTLRNTRDIVRSLFADTVLRGQRTPYNRFFEAVVPAGRARDDAAIPAAVAGCMNGLHPEWDADKVAAVAHDCQVNEFCALRSAFEMNPRTLREHVRVSIAPDKRDRLVLVVGVDGDAANMARLRYRAADAAHPRFGVFTPAMARMYEALTKASRPVWEVAVSDADDWMERRHKVAVAMRAMAACPNVLQDAAPHGGLTTLILPPRNVTAADSAYSAAAYAPERGVIVEGGKLTFLRGFAAEVRTPPQPPHVAPDPSEEFPTAPFRFA